MLYRLIATFQILYYNILLLLMLREAKRNDHDSIYVHLQVPITVCDYQVEVNLVSYNNPQGRLQDGSCCDLDSGSVCLPQDTCDVRLTFSVQNFGTSTTFNLQTKVLGTYENRDMITFASCSILTNNERNPIKFAIPTNQWRMGVSITS